jgi:hypothetical protein
MKAWLGGRNWLVVLLWVIGSCGVAGLGSWASTSELENDPELIALAVWATFTSWLITVPPIIWLASVTIPVPVAGATGESHPPTIVVGPDPRP